MSIPTEQFWLQREFLERTISVKNSSCEGYFLERTLSVKNSSCEGYFLERTDSVKNSSFLERTVFVKKASYEGYSLARTVSVYNASSKGWFLERNYPFLLRRQPSVMYSSWIVTIFRRTLSKKTSSFTKKKVTKTSSETKVLSVIFPLQ